MPFDEVLGLDAPEHSRIIAVAGDGGGVLLDHHPEKNVWRVMFAAFDEMNRDLGYLRACLGYAQAQGLDIALVEINGGEEAKIWRRLGYKNAGTMGMCMVITNTKDLDFINFDAVIS